MKTEKISLELTKEELEILIEALYNYDDFCDAEGDKKYIKEVNALSRKLRDMRD